MSLLFFYGEIHIHTPESVDPETDPKKKDPKICETLGRQIFLVETETLVRTLPFS